MAKNITSLHQKKLFNFSCIACNFNCGKAGDYNRHLLTAKHKILYMTNGITSITQITSNDKNSDSFDCLCGKKYKHKSSLSKHKKSCAIVEYELNKNNEKTLAIGSINEETIMKLIQENKDIKQMLYTQNETTNKLIDIIPKVINNTTTNNNIINNNQKFNINIFLNEKCKHAIDIKDFISQIQLTLENLDFSKKEGLEAGLTNVFIENMKKLSLYERPIHCTDTKRDTLYIKADDKWAKDTDKSKIKAALKTLNKSHFRLIKQWLDNNPNYMEDPSKQDYFARILKTCAGVFNDEKIIKKICTTNHIKTHINDLDENMVE
tara:strand:+ start:2251 stop:3213 length:963 start_codon:yes stop_codon:yes gene_type:complete